MAWLGLLSSFVGACGGDQGVRGEVETGHLRISTTTGNPICAGTPLLLEGELERMAGVLGLPLWPEDDKLDARFGQEAVAEVCAGIFGGDAEQANGCAVDFGDEPTVAATEVDSLGFKYTTT